VKYQRTWAEINLAHLSHNLAAIKKLSNQANIMGIVKADAYGHGAVPVARTILECGAVKSLGVAICEEGIQLREAGITSPILIMGHTPQPLIGEAIKLNLTQTIFSKDCASVLVAEAARAGKRAVIHIKIDTGMSRLGFLPNHGSIVDICEIANNPNIALEGIYTHCATSDSLQNEFVLQQQARFKWMLAELAARGIHIPVKHMANSGAIVQKALGLEGLNMDIIRPGILMYGYPPSAEMGEACAHMGLIPAMRLVTRINMIKHLPEGVGISYGHIYKTKRPSKIAVLPIGYADGYPRRLSQGGRVLVKGHFAPIAGAICMDQCMIDVTDIPNVQAGDRVYMMGKPGICADNLAEHLGTISYEILCGIGKRVPRVYV